MAFAAFGGALPHSHHRPLRSLPNILSRLVRLRPEKTRICRASSKFCISCKHKQAHRDGEEEAPTRQRSRKQQVKHQVLEFYRSRFAEALRAELNEEMEEVKQRVTRCSRQKLESEGLALFDLSVQHEGNLFRDRILRFYTKSRDGFLPPHNQFSQGDIVMISQRNPLEEDTAVEGVVLERARRFIRVAVSPNQSKELGLNKKWRLDLYANRVAYERCLFAVEIFSSPLVRPHGLVCNLARVNTNSSGGWLSEGGFSFGEGATAIRELLIKSEGNKMQHLSLETKMSHPQPNGGEPISERLEELKIAKSPPSKISGKHLGSAKGDIRAYLQGLGDKLNNSQKKAVETAALQRVTLWQGPPGTGKTRTLTYCIAAFCKTRGKVLACADSNVAVDNLVEGLLGLGLKVVRVGQPVKVKEEFRQCTIDAHIAHHPLTKKALDFKREAALQKNKKLWEKAEELERRAVKDVLDRADVIAATCIGAGDNVLTDCSFHACVIDEATQATEPAALVPVLRSGADCIVLVGDPAQLPPTVVSSAANKAGLDISLYQRLEEYGLKPCFLDTQYRMHPEIAAIPSSMFYSGRLKSHPSPFDRQAPTGLPWPDMMKPIVFMDCINGKEKSTAGNNSWFNSIEATQVFKVLRLLLSKSDIKSGCGGIGIIAPYSAQVRLLEDMIFRGQKDGHDLYSGLEVKTVDGFQGREKEVIIFCTVRANEMGQLGFVSDPRRMNVALTRAKCGLVVVGNSETLNSDRNWATWLGEIKKENLHCTIEAPDGRPCNELASKEEQPSR